MKRIILIAMVVLMSAPTVLAQDFCKGDFNYNGNVAAEDVEIFLEHFGRSIFSNPCPPDGPAPVARTGQTTSYLEGDDGGVGKGVEWPNPMYTDNENGTVTDNLTGLIWLKNANCFGVRHWDEAITDCNVLADGQCGLTDGSSGGDWRLPNLRELFSLLDHKFYEPALSNSAGTGQWTLGDPFINLVTPINSSLYWSSTTYAKGSDAAFYVNLYHGGVDGSGKLGLIFFWPVRGGH